MKIAVDGVELFTITDIQKKVFQHDMRSETYEQELLGLLKYVIEQKFSSCLSRLKDKWDKKLIAEGAEFLPSSKEEYAELVLKHKDYEDRSKREEKFAKKRKEQEDSRKARLEELKEKEKDENLS